MPVIEVDQLERRYRARTGIRRRAATEVQAVRQISFDVERGELFGLLGPNGAGKTTTIKMLITLLLPSAGSARVLGYDVVQDAQEVRRRVGYVFGGDRGLYERLSGLDNLRYFAELYAGRASRADASASSSSSSACLDGRRSASRVTHAACDSACTSRAGCCTVPRCCSWTSPASASTRSAHESCGRPWRSS